MQLYSTNNKSKSVPLQEAVLKGLPDDNGLFMPTQIPKVSSQFINNLSSHSFEAISYEVASTLFQGVIPESDLKNIIEKAINFPAPIVSLANNLHVLELFHGPSLAFKDFGARFMAQLMSYFNRGESKELVILVATSGDTGGAVAAGFYKTPGVKVVILYPSGKVSPLQEKQLTTLGHNISALEVNGTFDDCQALVKEAFLDQELSGKIRLSSANSINIARLIPQSFYYFEAFKQLQDKETPVVFCVPSGNFGNLTAGILAKKMGLPVHHFVAATNINKVVPEYLSTGTYTPSSSIRTLSNAMDVGAPSNFARMLDFFTDIDPECSTWNNMQEQISGFYFDDAATKHAMIKVNQEYNYTLDPHGAVGYLAINKYLSEHKATQGVFLETAHPSKFVEEVTSILGHSIEIPERLAELSTKTKVARMMNNDFHEFKEWLSNNY